MFLTSVFLVTHLLVAETMQSQSVQRINTEISNVALDYIPDVAFVFSSGKKALLPGTTNNFYSTKVFIELESQGKSASELMSKLELPYRKYGEEEVVYKDINSFTLRLWDIYAAAIKNGITPAHLKVKLKIVKHDASVYQYDLTPLSTLEELSFGADSQPINDPYKQLPLTLAIKMVGYRTKLFDKIWGWRDLLPPGHLMSASFLNQYAKTKRQESKNNFNINDVLDLFYAYSSGMLRDDNFTWPSNLELESDPRSKQKVLIQHIVQKTSKTNIDSREYWIDLVTHFSNVEKLINFDLSAQRYEVERVLNTEYPQGENFQIISSSTTNIVNTVTVNNSQGTPVHSTSATDEYYRYKLAREKSEQNAEYLRGTYDLFNGIRETLPDIFFPRL